MTPDTSPVVVGGRSLPGDLRALLDQMPGGVRVAQALVLAGQVETTRHLLAVEHEALRYVKGLGGQPGVRPLVEHLRTAWGVQPGCLAGAPASVDEDAAAWDRIWSEPANDLHHPAPEGRYTPGQMAAIRALGGRRQIRTCTTFDLPKLRERFLQIARGAS